MQRKIQTWLEIIAPRMAMSSSEGQELGNEGNRDEESEESEPGYK